MKKLDNNGIKKILSVVRGWIANFATKNEVVDRASDQVILGQKVFGASADGFPFAVARRKSLIEALLVGLTDKVAEIRYVNDEDTSTLKFVIENTDTESSDGSNASEHAVTFEASKNTLTMRLPGMYVAKKGFRTEGGRSSHFLKADGSVDTTAYATTAPATTSAKGLMPGADKAFIDDLRDSGIMPLGGEKGQIIISNGEKGEWVGLDVLDLLSYGVEWDPNVSNPVLTRIGNMNYHKTLPIQSGMKGCIYNPKTKEVVYWLDEDNWKYKKGGNPDKGEPEQLARLDGYDGEVFVYVPEFWIKSCESSDKNWVRIIPLNIDNTWEYQPAIFLAAYRDTVLNTVPENMGYLSTLEVNTAISVCNNASYCRGGNNDATYDANEDIFKRQLGKCRTNIARPTFRAYARKGGKEIMSYKQYKNILYWLYVIEYANFNSQSTYTAVLTAEGFHKGGLGTGITNIPYGSGTTYNGRYPICPNGYTNELGNRTGTKLIAPLGPTPVGNVYANRWRGIENPFGDVWTTLDGVIVYASNSHEDDLNYIYATNDPDKYGDLLTDTDNMELVGKGVLGTDYIKEFALAETAEIIPNKLGGGPTTYKCDYQWTGTAGDTPRTVKTGGFLDINGVPAGLSCFFFASNADEASSIAGYRTVVVV